MSRKNQLIVKMHYIMMQKKNTSGKIQEKTSKGDIENGCNYVLKHTKLKERRRSSARERINEQKV